jgi:hypothetical protein
MDAMMVLPGESNLLEMILALDDSRRFARRLDGRQQQCDQNSDHRDDDEQL